MKKVFFVVTLLLCMAGFCYSESTLYIPAQKAVAQNATPSITPSTVRFTMVYCTDIGSSRLVFGVVAKEVDLSHEDTAKQILEQGVRFGQERCPAPLGRHQSGPNTFDATGQFENVKVKLSRGDPSTLTDDFAERNLNQDPWQMQREERLNKAYPDVVVYAWNRAATGFKWASYSNKATDARNEAERVKLANEQNRQYRQRIAQQKEVARVAQQRLQSEIAARSAAFVKAHGVAHFVTIQQLTANPFIYQGQVVAIYGDFQQMNSATQALFSSNNDNSLFVVSAIPKARFTQQRSEVMLAGRVLGKVEIKLPGLGPTLLPHLSFVGSAFCQQQYCSEYAIRLK